ncbi:CAZyme family GH16 [Penicillium roqueforti]|uniref:CAZyme family GH16 n=1 Tax=Penicillium roqueforti TaxID=5082 RepID=UPI00190C8E09|nr:CAZyme family GH16 [Penicillium roqueforti]KAF9253309.1 CAZyme family GH16 [Penicillium roqueforti]KAI1838825.1 CAZyme family GH16 [Penicillium roqueforti]KAI2680292.1 CAZyme family GH16 [Penicillium roqueforti]KAI2691319.1 CAZyme family GH16 [Penicillium roqueforti]KAI2746511.1 CAZyme family GH16 [Penicillium roqueforti]
MADSDPLLSDLCSICHTNPPKYRCPRCSTRTCSLPCTRRHKLWSQCSGVRDPAAYLKRQELNTPSAFDRDFNFITSIERTLERAEREVDNRGIDLAGGAQADDDNSEGSQHPTTGRKRKHPNQGLAKGEAAFLRGAETAGVKVLRAPKGMSRNKQNGSRLHPKHKRLAWTIEWITSDGLKTIRDSVIDTCSVAEAYNRCCPRPKDQEPATKPVKEEKKDLDTHNTTIAAPGDPVTTVVEEADTKQPSSPNKDSTKEPADDSTEQTDKVPNQTITPHRGLYFYLHRPRTTTKKPVLAPLLQSSTLNAVLRNRTVLEFPTIYALLESAETLFSDKDNSKFISEEEYLRTAGPDEIGQSSTASDDDGAAGNKVLASSSVNLQDVDENLVLEVLKKDLFEPVSETEPILLIVTSRPKEETTISAASVESKILRVHLHSTRDHLGNIKCSRIIMKTNVLSFGITVIYLGTVASALLVARPPSQLPAKKRPQGCDCYTISGPDPGYFQHYKVWDFRAVDLKKHANLNLSKPIDYDDEDWDDDAEAEGQEPQNGRLSPGVHNEKDPDPRSLLFYKTSFEKDWSSQNWERRGTPIAPVLMINSKHNVFLTRDSDQNNPHATYLVLRTTRFSEYTSTAEIETRIRNIYRCSLRVRLRLLPAGSVVSQPPQHKEWPPRDPQRHPTVPLNKTIPLRDSRPPDGACAGIFTYHDSTCESDIEILTRDPSHRVHYANQPDYDFAADHEIPNASTIADIPVPWTTWSTHRLDWLSDMSRWYVNNQIQDAKSYRVPELESMIVLNLWSDGGLWTGDMRIGDSIYMGIEYIELVYNRSSDAFRAPYVSPSQNQAPPTNGSFGNGNPLEPDRKDEKCKPGLPRQTIPGFDWLACSVL